jgi:hypothetical protein
MFQNVEKEPNLLLDQPVQLARRGRPPESKNHKESWKNTTAPEYKIKKQF